MPFGDPKLWMWAEACEIIDRAERLHRQFFRPGAAVARQPVWEAPADIFETELDLWIVIALPGVSPESIVVRVESGTLVVTGERLLPAEMRRAAIHRLEIPHGRFERRSELPPGRYELDGTRLADGCLTLRLRKI
ncbi:MAG: Hsp20/alpha crystallin family protein [Rhodospirillaceae bacterium]|nr:Hsp20/alpha crystallin family protein [Rhodospirillaceae bacterium]